MRFVTNLKFYFFKIIFLFIISMIFLKEYPKHLNVIYLTFILRNIDQEGIVVK